MSKKLFEKLTSQSDALRNSSALKPLNRYLHDANLWHLNRHSVARAFFAAFFISISLMLFPCHTITTALLAVWLRANLPISLSLVWLVNPFTIPPLAYAAIKIGLIVMPGVHTHDVKQVLHFDWGSNATLMQKIADFWQVFERVWEPFMLGSFTLGLLVGISSYLMIQWFWRWSVIRKWNKRQLLRLQSASRS